MRYISTRGGMSPRSFSRNPAEGLATDGGLALPDSYPACTSAELAALRHLNYRDLAFNILSRFVDDIPAADLRQLIDRTYTAAVFGSEDITPLKTLEPGLHILQTLQRPDAGVQGSRAATARQSVRVCVGKNPGRTEHILGATSGDTGSAAEYAMRGKRGVRVFMLSPHGKMSRFQTAQMYSLADPNIFNIAVKGVFDDCQDIVKQVSNDDGFKSRYHIGTVNSINWGRVAAQIVYYFKGYFAATRDNSESVSFAGAVRQFRQYPGRPHRAHDGAADPAPDPRHQREQCAGRILPHWPLSAARVERSETDDEPVDGHFQSVELRAFHVRRGGPRQRQSARAVAGCGIAAAISISPARRCSSACPRSVLYPAPARTRTVLPPYATSTSALA